MISYIQILQYIEAFAYQHMQIQRFGADFFEQIENFSSKGKNFPILYIVPVDNTSEENIKRWTIDVYCFDIIEKSRDNINTIVSDTELILNDLVLWFRDGELNIDLGNNPVKLPLNNKLLDFCAGHSMRLQLITDQSTICEIPFRDVPELINNVCDISYNYNCNPAVITNSDNSLTFIAPSGETSVLPDSIITINNDSINLPATNDITINVKNNSGNDVGELTINNTFIIDDTILTVNDTIIQSIDAEDTFEFNVKLDGVNSGSWNGSTNTWEVESIPCPTILNWELNYNGTDDVIFIPTTINNSGTLNTGSGNNVGIITISIDDINYTTLSFPFSPIVGTTYFFKRSDATVNGTYTMEGEY